MSERCAAIIKGILPLVAKEAKDADVDETEANDMLTATISRGDCARMYDYCV